MIRLIFSLPCLSPRAQNLFVSQAAQNLFVSQAKTTPPAKPRSTAAILAQCRECMRRQTIGPGPAMAPKRTRVLGVPRRTPAPARSKAAPAASTVTAGGPGAGTRRRTLQAAGQPSCPEAGRVVRSRHLLALDEQVLAAGTCDGDGGGDGAGDSSSSESDTHVAVPVRARGKRARTLATRSRRRSALYLDMMVNANSRGRTLLEDLAVTERTRSRYQRYLDRFFSWRGITELELTRMRDEEVDAAFCQYCTEKYLAGEQCNFGEQTTAAWLHAHPSFGRAGARFMPRTWRAMKAWRRLTPGRRRRGVALAVWCGLAWRLVEKDLTQMAVFLLVGVSAYSRPSSLLAARRCDLVPPAAGLSQHWCLLTHPEERQVPSKTGRFDEGCLLDSPYLQGLASAFRLMAHPTSTARLWNFTYPEVAEALKKAAEELNVGAVTLYQMRHSGASIDLVRRYRSLEEAQRRGAWSQAKSMHRYEHSSRITYDYLQLDALARSQCEEAERHISEIILGRPHPPIGSRTAIQGPQAR